MASSIAYETHPVDGRVAKITNTVAETSSHLWMPRSGGEAYLSSTGAGTSALEMTRSLPSQVKASTAVWTSLVAATATDGVQTIPGCTAIRLITAGDGGFVEVRTAPIL